MYSLLRKTALLLRELLDMTYALLPALVPEQTSSATIAEKLDLDLDFVKTSLPPRTRLTYPHILFTPLHYEPNYAYPLLVWLHGTGEDERQLLRIMPKISLQNYAAAAPRGLLIEQSTTSPKLDLSISSILQRPKDRYDWLLTEDNLMPIEQQIFDCIAVAQERCNIANHRIFIAGFGTGGTAALQLATLYPEYFAGVAAFGAEIPTGYPIFPTGQRTQPLAILLGTDESIPEHACQMMELFYTAGLTADVQEYSDTKQLTPAMLQDLNRWMMQIVCSSTSTKVPHPTEHC